MAALFKPSDMASTVSMVRVSIDLASVTSRVSSKDETGHLRLRAASSQTSSRTLVDRRHLVTMRGRLCANLGRVNGFPLRDELEHLVLGVPGAVSVETGERDGRALRRV